MDTISIRDLKVTCIIGTKPKERETPQEVLINIALDCDLGSAGKSDDLNDTVNYCTLTKEIVARLEESQFFLIERMAQEIADMCLAEDRVAAVTVTLDKPGALTQARSVAVEIRRGRGN